MKMTSASVVLAGLLGGNLLLAQLSWPNPLGTWTLPNSLDTWTQQTNGLPMKLSQLRSVAYGNGRFVAVGYSDIVTSTDGINWTWRQSFTSGTNASGVATNTQLMSVAFGNGKFAAIGYEGRDWFTGALVIETSADGTNWSALELPVQAFGGGYLDGDSIAFGNNRFVAVAPGFWGSSGAWGTVAFVSTDGTNWFEHPFTQGQVLGNLTFDNGLFACRVGGLWSSSDGISWTPRSELIEGDWKPIGSGNGMFVVSDNYGDSAIFSSTDLVYSTHNWTACTPSSDYMVHNGIEPLAIGYGNGIFLLSGVDLNGSAVIISAPASSPLHWSRRYTGSAVTPYGLTYGNGLWVAVGSQGIMTSGTLIKPPPLLTGLHLNLTAVTTVRSNLVPVWRYVAVGELGSILGSSNGVDWVIVGSPSTNRLGGVTATADGSYIAVGDRGTILTSTDGLNWSLMTSVVTNSLYGVAAAQNGTNSARVMDVAVGAGGVFLTSTNSTQWSLSAFRWTNDLTSITFGNGEFDALASDGTLLVSTNGLNWTVKLPQLPGGASLLSSLSFGDGQFTALDSTGDVLTSLDGLRWNLLLAGIASGLSAQLNGISFLNGHLLAVGSGGTILGTQLGINGTGTDKSLNAITYGNGLYVAMGDFGTIIKSVDGASWTAPTNYILTRNNLSAVAYGNGLFVGVGDAAWIVRSLDGDNWTSGSTATTVADLRAVAFGAGRFVAVGSKGNIITSTDGSQWAVAGSGTTVDLGAVTWANGQFVITGDSYQTSLTSTNGINWTGGGGGLQSLTYGVAGGNGVFVAVDHSGKIFSSTDGLAWIQRAGTGVALSSVSYGSGIFVAAGQTGAWFVSSNGTNWTQIQSITDEMLNGVVGGDGQFVAIGSDGTSLTAGVARLTSMPTDIGWLAISPPTTDNLYSVVFNGQICAAVGAGSAGSMVSSNGLNWSATGSGLNGVFYGVSWGNGLFVVVGYQGVIFTSGDGKSWTQVADVQARLNAIAFGGGAFVAVANSGEVFRSIDGIRWASHTTGLAGNLQAIVYGNGQFVTVADDGTIATSTNGNSWTLGRSPTFQSLHSVSYGNKQYIAVGEKGTIVTSADGTSWTLQTNSVLTACALRAVAWGNNQFLAVGDEGWTMRSGEGTNWISSSSATVNNLYSITFANGRFVAVGAGGTIIATALVAPSQLAATRLADGSLHVTLRGTAGRSYTIEVSTDLINWNQLASLILTGTTGQFVDSSASSRAMPGVFYRRAMPYVFYRAVLLP